MATTQLSPSVPSSGLVRGANSFLNRLTSMNTNALGETSATQMALRIMVWRWNCVYVMINIFYCIFFVVP